MQITMKLCHGHGKPTKIRIPFLFTKSPLQVKEGLASALRLFRDVHKPQWLWFDGVCINYEDPTEKSEQVQLMADIYSGALTAHVWLGAGTANTYDAMRFVQTILDMNAVEELLKFPLGLALVG